MANLPWQNRPENNKDILWRYSKNPIINRYDIPSSNSIFNSAVVPYKEGFAGVFRCDNKAVQMNIFAGFSQDGLNWEINHDPIKMQAGNTKMIESDYKYDPRVVFIEDRYWITWCNGLANVVYCLCTNICSKCKNPGTYRSFICTTIDKTCFIKKNKSQRGHRNFANDCRSDDPITFLK